MCRTRSTLGRPRLKEENRSVLKRGDDSLKNSRGAAAQVEGQISTVHSINSASNNPYLQLKRPLIINNQGASINHHQAEQMDSIGGPNHHRKNSATVTEGAAANKRRSAHLLEDSIIA
jgi:hypothetical protein